MQVTEYAQIPLKSVETADRKKTRPFSSLRLSFCNLEICCTLGVIPQGVLQVQIKRKTLHIDSGCMTVHY